MSIEYTIDIQLTELGFPDVLSLDTSAGETPCRSTSSDDSLTTHKQKLLIRPSACGRTVTTEKYNSSAKTEHCKPLNLALDQRGEQTDKDTAQSEEPRSRLHDPVAEKQTTDSPQLLTQQHDPGEEGGAERNAAPAHSVEMEQDVEDDSDDSEVSEMFEEEELDEEEDEDEGGLNNELHQGDYRCNVCDLQVPSKFKLQDHMNLHTGDRPYCCAECGKRFSQIYNYRVHLRTHAQTKVAKELLMCRVCLKGFQTEENLSKHLSSNHPEDTFYECDLCKRVFTSLMACENHVRLHKYMVNFQCAKCSRAFSSMKHLTRHLKRTCSRNFKCTDCTKVFTKKNALLKHSFSHLGMLPYTCVRCRCHFRLPRLYRLHKCTPGRIHCVACLREFLSQEDFQRHKKDTGCWGNQEPEGDKIRCLECGQRFETSEELKKHAGAHQRVLKCAECGKGFRSALLLMSHMGGHAGKSPCLCQSCGLGFPHQQNYDSHLKTCGQTAQPSSTSKKQQASKSSSSGERRKKQQKKNPSAKPDTAAAADRAATPTALETGSSSSGQTEIQASGADPKDTTSSPDAVTGPQAAAAPPDAAARLLAVAAPPDMAGPSDMASPQAAVGPPDVVIPPAAAASPDGLWKLTLDKQPPPGMNLVVFLPVCPPEANGLSQPGSALQVQPAHLALTAAIGAPLSERLDLATGIKQDPVCEEPMDLSKKSKSVPSDRLVHPIKREPEEFEIIDSKEMVRATPGETDTYSEIKRFKMESSGLNPINLTTTSSGLFGNIKTELQSHSLHLCSSGSQQLLDQDIKAKVEN
ncbi:uncharacterized protein V6R79_016524 [Siganus canaliculatus]